MFFKVKKRGSHLPDRGVAEEAVKKRVLIVAVAIVEVGSSEGAFRSVRFI